MTSRRWRVIAIAQGVVIVALLTGIAGFALGRASGGTARVATASPQPTASSTPDNIPSPSAVVSPVIVASPVPVPIATQPAEPARFILVSADWVRCTYPACFGHGIFRNVGGSIGSVPVRFTVPVASGGTCVTVIPSTLPTSSSEAACDLGRDAANYYDTQSPNSLKAPVVAIG